MSNACTSTRSDRLKEHDRWISHKILPNQGLCLHAHCTSREQTNSKPQRLKALQGKSQEDPPEPGLMFDQQEAYIERLLISSNSEFHSRTEVIYTGNEKGMLQISVSIYLYHVNQFYIQGKLHFSAASRQNTTLSILCLLLD